jgi:iron complex transport system substrate-binding protein
MIGALFALAASAPTVFSADYCADQLVLKLADRRQIAAVSVDADKDFSHLRAAAAGLAQARPDAERVVRSGADVVLRFWGGDDARLIRFGVDVVTLDYAADFAGVKANIRRAAAALDRVERGERLVDEIDRRLAALAARGASGARALYFTPGGVTAGRKTMIDAIFAAAGVRNVAAEQGLDLWPTLSAETLILDPPPRIVAGFFSANSERINPWSAARHPALQRVLKATAAIELPADLLSCPGWHSVEAAERLRDRIEAAP